MFYKCDHCDYESNREYNIRRHVKNKHESHHPNNENQVDNDVSLEQSTFQIMRHGIDSFMLQIVEITENQSQKYIK